MGLPIIVAAVAIGIGRKVFGKIFEKRRPKVYKYESSRTLKTNTAGTQFYHMAAEGILEDASSTYGGTASVGIDTPFVIARYLLTEMGGVVSGDFTTGASTFGSFTQAITDLNAKVTGDWQIHFGIYEPESMGSLLARLLQQAPINIWRSQWTNKWCATVYKQTPDTWDYFLDPYGNPYSISYDTDVIDDPEVTSTEAVDCLSEIHVKYRLFAPTNSLTRDTWIGPSGSDDGLGTRDQNTTAPNNRETLLSDSQTQLNVKTIYTIECDSHYLTTTSTAFRNYLADRYYRPRITLALTVWARFAGIEPGQILKISDDWLDRIGPPPKYPYGTTAKKWSDLNFFVSAAPIIRNKSGQPVIDLLLEEVI